jgi:hypothetical protein
MSAQASDRPPGGRDSGAFSGLPSWLAPRAQGAQEPARSRRRWVIETVVLVLAGAFLLIATSNDLARQRDVNERLNADLRTWRAYTGHDYHSISLDTLLLGRNSERAVVCGNTSPGGPKQRTQICLMVWGPIHDGKRPVHGGWYLPPHSEDTSSARYGCFGAAAQRYCRR